MARFSLLPLLLLLASCGEQKPQPAEPVVAPYPKEYTCEQSKKAAAEFDALPPGSMLRVYVSDYGQERRELRAALNLPTPPACPK